MFTSLFMNNNNNNNIIIIIIIIIFRLYLFINKPKIETQV